MQCFNLLHVAELTGTCISLTRSDTTKIGFLETRPNYSYNIRSWNAAGALHFDILNVNMSLYYATLFQK